MDYPIITIERKHSFDIKHQNINFVDFVENPFPRVLKDETPRFSPVVNGISHLYPLKFVSHRLTPSFEEIVEKNEWLDDLTFFAYANRDHRPDRNSWLIFFEVEPMNKTVWSMSLSKLTEKLGVYVDHRQSLWGRFFTYPTDGENYWFAHNRGKSLNLKELCGLSDGEYEAASLMVSL